MHHTSKRVSLIKERARSERRRQAKTGICRLAALCVVLFSALLWGMQEVTDMSRLAILGMSGSILLHEQVGGYVLVGIVSFTASVLIQVMYAKHSGKFR